MAVATTGHVRLLVKFVQESFLFGVVARDGVSGQSRKAARRAIVGRRPFAPCARQPRAIPSSARAPATRRLRFGHVEQRRASSLRRRQMFGCGVITRDRRHGQLQMRSWSTFGSVVRVQPGRDVEPDAPMKIRLRMPQGLWACDARASSNETPTRELNRFDAHAGVGRSYANRRRDDRRAHGAASQSRIALKLKHEPHLGAEGAFAKPGQRCSRACSNCAGKSGRSPARAKRSITLARSTRDETVLRYVLSRKILCRSSARGDLKSSACTRSTRRCPATQGRFHRRRTVGEAGPNKRFQRLMLTPFGPRRDDAKKATAAPAVGGHRLRGCSGACGRTQTGACPADEGRGGRKDAICSARDSRFRRWLAAEDAEERFEQMRRSRRTAVDDVPEVQFVLLSWLTSPRRDRAQPVRRG